MLWLSVKSTNEKRPDLESGLVGKTPAATLRVTQGFVSMQWLRSGIGEIWPPKIRFKDAPMSAIAVVYTSRSGFVIGADGFARWSHPEIADERQRRMESDKEQKIFEATSTHGAIAYAITGTAYNEDKSFSVIAESQKAAEAIAGKNLANHLEYVEQFSKFVSARIAEAHQQGRFDYLPAKICAPGHENTIVRLLFCGYFRRRPFAYDVEIINEQEVLSCNPTQYDLRQMAPVVLGSERIAKLMYVEQDARFKNFTVRITDTSWMPDAISSVRGYLEACSTPLARKIDPFCEIVGGHIHIATITPQFGFQWSSRPDSSD